MNGISSWQQYEGIPTTGKAKEVWDALVKLGNTPDEVAESLYTMGYSGCHKADNCPIANYLADRVITVSPVMVSSSRILVEGASWEIPRAVGSFVFKFDDDAYPHLKDNDAASDQ